MGAQGSVADGARLVSSSGGGVLTCAVNMLNDLGKAARGLGELALVTLLLLKVVDNGTRRHRLERQHVARHELGALAAVDELTGVGTFGGSPLHLVGLEFVRVLELNLGHWRTTSRVVNDFPNDTTDVAVALGEVDGTQRARALAMLVVGSKDGPPTLTLPTDLATLQTHRHVRQKSAGFLAGTADKGLTRLLAASHDQHAACPGTMICETASFPTGGYAFAGARRTIF